MWEPYRKDGPSGSPECAREGVLGKRVETVVGDDEEKAEVAVAEAERQPRVDNACHADTSTPIQTIKAEIWSKIVCYNLV